VCGSPNESSIISGCFPARAIVLSLSSTALFLNCHAILYVLSIQFEAAILFINASVGTSFSELRFLPSAVL